MTINTKLKDLVSTALEDMKAVDVTELDVREMTTITDLMIIASGTSDRHVRAIGDHVAEVAKANDHAALGIEGGDEGEWVLVDLGEIVVHLMLPRIRDFYNLEKLWESPGFKARRDASSLD
ncbi:MAG: ribosome silencing factor [Gammaproteobacteria bacterium]|nr:ribosome silencing factor [Gammaproteobacteria bacterium]NNF66070.1 ribosome silencing factor [Gammaproteobacteria bacterium]